MEADQSGVAHASVDLTVSAGAPASPTPTPSPSGACPGGLSGIARDGLPADGHDNPLPGIQVQLMRGGNPIGTAVMTDLTGRYCILPSPGVIDPGDYTVRATLVDAAHDPALYEIRHGTDTDPPWAETTVTTDDFGQSDVDVPFTSDGSRPWLPDVANIDWQEIRFVRWITETLGIPISRPYTVVTFDSTATGAYYLPLSSTVHIPVAESVYSERDEPLDHGPDNVEWHETSHHLAATLAIAFTCPGDAPHGGWPNPTTCDSLSEGFAMFLPTLASLDLDAGRGHGYGTGAYDGFGSLEDNSWKAWTAQCCASGAWIEREDLAVAALLWDLVDDTPNEVDQIWVSASQGDRAVSVPDLITMSAIELISLLHGLRSVDSLYQALLASPSVSPTDKTPSIDLNGDGNPDISPLDAVFLLHGFHPVADQTAPAFHAGDPISRTDHVPGSLGGLTSRSTPVDLPGAAIRLMNASAAPAVYSIDVTYPTTSSHFEVAVAAGSNKLVHLEVPPYWRAVLGKGDPLPACGGKEERLVTIKLSGPSGASRTFDNCEYLHDVMKATDGAAVAFDGSLAAVVNSPAMGGNALFIVLVVAVAALLAGGATLVFLLRRRRGVKGSD